MEQRRGEASCKSCSEPITWGEAPGGHWVPLDAKPDGEWVFLPESKRILQIGGRWHALEDLPPSLRRTIPDEMVAWWTKVLSGPHYSPHSKECRQAVAMSLGHVLKDVV